MKKIITIFICFILVGLYCYFKPVSEKLFCDNNYNCVATHNFILGISVKRNIKISNSASLGYEIRKRSDGRTYYNGLYPVVRDNNNYFEPFIYYYSINYKSAELLVSRFNIIQQEFSEYLKKPDKTFSISSAADFLNVIMPLLIIFGLFSVAFIWVQIEEFISKRR